MRRLSNRSGVEDLLRLASISIVGHQSIAINVVMFESYVARK